MTESILICALIVGGSVFIAVLIATYIFIYKKDYVDGTYELKRAKAKFEADKIQRSDRILEVINKK